MRRFLKELPTGAEFAIVIGIAFGYLILGSILLLLSHRPVSAFHTGATLIALTVYELAVLALLLPFLAVRGWTVKRLGVTPSLRDTAIGIGFFLITYVIWLTALMLIAIVSPSAAQPGTPIVQSGISMASAMLIVLVNPFFEEVLVCGYVVAALKRDDNPWPAINTSVAIRLAYHLYQGPVGVINVIPMGLLAAWWFARTGRLWPVIVMHAIGDFLPLIFLVRS